MKLTYQKQVRIVKRKEKGLSCALIAGQFGLSRRRVEQVCAHFRKTGSYLTLTRPGRKPYRKQNLSLDAKIITLKRKYNWGATYIAKYLRDKDGVAIGNGYIHCILLNNSMATPNPKKQKRKAPWVRYEREHSLTLVHLDWHYNAALEKWVCAVLDDASRNILAGGEYDNAYEDYAIQMLEKAYSRFLHIKPIEQVITDHGPQFYANKQNDEGTAKARFQVYCENNGIKHILCKYHHPQSNGKYEKWNHTYELNRQRFPSFDQFVEWYNNRPHGSLDFMTPNHAFYFKLQDVILGGFLKWAEQS